MPSLAPRCSAPSLDSWDADILRSGARDSPVPKQESFQWCPLCLDSLAFATPLLGGAALMPWPAGPPPWPGGLARLDVLQSSAVPSRYWIAVGRPGSDYVGLSPVGKQATARCVFMCSYLPGARCVLRIRNRGRVEEVKFRSQRFLRRAGRVSGGPNYPGKPGDLALWKSLRVETPGPTRLQCLYVSHSAFHRERLSVHTA